MKMNKKGSWTQESLGKTLLMLLVLLVLGIGIWKLAEYLNESGNVADNIKEDVDKDGVMNAQDMCCCKITGSSDPKNVDVRGCPNVGEGKKVAENLCWNPPKDYEVPECTVMGK